MTPKWAIDAALSRLGIDADATNFDNWRDRTYARAVQMVAHLIAAHEEPPADPLYDALKAVVELGRYDTREQTELLRAELVKRGFCIGSASKEPTQ